MAVRGWPAFGQGPGLGDEISPEFLVVGDAPGELPILVVLGPDNADKIDGKGAALVGQLEEGVLGVGTRFPENDDAGGYLDRPAVGGHGLAVAFHIKLLNMGGQFRQRRGVRDDGLFPVSQKIIVPDADQGRRQGHVLLRRGGQGVDVHVMGALQERHKPVIPQIEA